MASLTGVVVSVAHTSSLGQEAKRTQLAELAIGDEQSTQRPQALKSFVAMSLGSVLADGEIGGVDRLGVKLGRLPNEVLDQIALILRQQEVLGLFDDLSDVRDKLLAIFGQLLGRVREGLGSEEAVERNVDLLVLKPC